MTALPWGAELTYDDLRRMPEDGHRYEILDGVLLVTPGPESIHQLCQGEIFFMIRSLIGPDLVVLTAPFDYVISSTTVLQPDLLVTRRADLGRLNLERTPLLVIEVLSPSTRHLDAGSKRLAYEAAGVPWYWIIDPREPSILVLELVDGRYREFGRARDEEALEITAPVALTVVPARLVDGARG